MARAAKEIGREPSGWPGVEAKLHRFGETEFHVRGHEIGHVHEGRQAVTVVVGPR